MVIMDRPTHADLLTLAEAVYSNAHKTICVTYFGPPCIYSWLRQWTVCSI